MLWVRDKLLPFEPSDTSGLGAGNADRQGYPTAEPQLSPRPGDLAGLVLEFPGKSLTARSRPAGLKFLYANVIFVDVTSKILRR